MGGLFGKPTEEPEQREVVQEQPVQPVQKQNSNRIQKTSIINHNKNKGPKPVVQQEVEQNPPVVQEGTVNGSTTRVNASASTTRVNPSGNNGSTTRVNASASTTRVNASGNNGSTTRVNPSGVNVKSQSNPLGLLIANSEPNGEQLSSSHTGGKKKRIYKKTSTSMKKKMIKKKSTTTKKSTKKSTSSSLKRRSSKK